MKVLGSFVLTLNKPGLNQIEFDCIVRVHEQKVSHTCARTKN